VKHLEVRQLWVQDHIERSNVVCQKIPREINFADLFTHHWTTGEGEKFETGLGVERMTF
jgi:hypothetical protein